jgi:hypothetical protein
MYMSSGTGSPRPGATALALGSALALGLLAGACFNPPAGAVQFACDPAGDAACPAGYECRDDGCCHREGSEGDDGACKLGVASISASGVGDASSGGSTGDGSTGAPGTATATTGDPESTGGGTGTGDASTSFGTTTSGSTTSGSTTSGSTTSGTTTSGSTG